MKNRIPSALALVAALTFALLSDFAVSAAQDTSAPPGIFESNATEEARQALRANLALQEQVRTLQRSLEDYRQQSEANARRSEESLATRFGSIERSLDDQRKSLEAQRQRELETSRTMMYVAGGFAVAGLVAILITAWIQMRTVQRLTEVSASLRLGAGLPFPLALAEGMAPGESMVALSKQRYLDEVQRLQRRVQDLEHPGAAPEAHPGNGNSTAEARTTSDPAPTSARSSPQTSPGPAAQVAALIGKGQTFLNLDQGEKALECFDEALALDPGHVDALIKRGAALERLQRFDDAIAVYDRIIGLDERQTTAYLLKGGVFNRMKRFNDALACYDQALKTQSQRKG